MRTTIRRALWLGTTALLIGGAAHAQAPHPGADDFVPVTDEMLQNPDAADWINWRRTYNGWAHSPLTQITRENIGQLQMVWGWNMEPGTSQPTPLVYDGVMYLANPRDAITALNAANGDFIWQYTRELPEGAGGGTSGATRNIAIFGDRIFTDTADSYAMAFDARTGQVVWETQTGDWEKDRVAFSTGPIVANGKLIAGQTGCSRFREDRSGCYVMAHDPESGEELWRTYTVATAGEPGGDTWGDLPDFLRAGGSAWIPCAFDPELNLLYCGTGQPYPWPQVTRGTTGDALYTNSTLALDADTGEMQWFYQYVPGESLDLDEVFDHVLIDIDEGPAFFKIGKGGILWSLNRETGDYLSRTAMVYNNVYDFNEETGQAILKPDLIPADFTTPVFSCPSTAGGKDWHPMAFNPNNRNLFMGLSQTCMNFTAQQVEQVVGGGGSGGFRTFAPMPGAEGQQGKLSAINVDTLEIAWEHEQEVPFLTGMLSTESDLVFAGDLDRYYKAFDANTGEIVWQVRLSQSAQGMPVTYEVDGRQYVALPTGLGGGSPRAQSALVPHIRIPATGNVLYVFALPEGAM